LPNHSSTTSLFIGGYNFNTVSNLENKQSSNISLILSSFSLIDSVQMLLVLNTLMYLLEYFNSLLYAFVTWKCLMLMLESLICLTGSSNDDCVIFRRGTLYQFITNPDSYLMVALFNCLFAVYSISVHQPNLLCENFSIWRAPKGRRNPHGDLKNQTNFNVELLQNGCLIMLLVWGIASRTCCRLISCICLFCSVCWFSQQLLLVYCSLRHHVFSNTLFTIGHMIKIESSLQLYWKKRDSLVNLVNFLNIRLQLNKYKFYKM